MRPTGRLLLASLLLLLAPASAFAVDGGAWTMAKGEWFTEIRANRISSNAQFLIDGRDQSLPLGERIQEAHVSRDSP